MKFWFLPIALVMAALAACSPSEQESFSSGKKAAAAKGADDDDTTTPASNTDPSSPTYADAGPSTPSTIDPFQGSTFSAIKALDSTSDHHLGDSNAGRNCLACHGKDMGAPEFILAGTIQKSATDADPAVGVQVRVVDPTGTEVANVGTDENGNFWLAGTTALPAGSTVGIRDASGSQKMAGTVSAGSCNQTNCHNQDRRIFLAK